MSNFVITYNSNPQSGDIFSVQDALTLSQLIEVDYSNASILGSTVDETIQVTTFYLQNAYNNTNLYVITPDYLNDTITIEANNDNSTFTEIENDSSGRISININNTPTPSQFTIDSIVLSEADSDPCNNVKLTITTSPQATDITSPITDVVNTNPYIVDIQRTGDTVITMNDADGVDTKKLFIPALVSADFSTDIVNAPNGGTVTITNNYTKSLSGSFTLEYSLDNVNWYLSNSFSGLAVGSYTAYVRDGIGCSFTLDFDIDEFSPTIDPRIDYVFVSNSGSFRWKTVQDLTTNIPTIENTLSYEENVDNPVQNYTQPYQNNDGEVYQQFRSSLETNTAFLIDCDGNEAELTVTQKTNNIGIEDVRDARILDIVYTSQNYVGIQFGSGNTYDPVTLDVTGTYALGNSLPEWIDIEEYLNIQNAGWLKVIDIITIDGVETAVMNSLVSDYPETIDQQGLSRRVTSVYNQLDYEVYEFSVDMTNLSGIYYMEIRFSDSEFTQDSKRSEFINVKETHRRTHLFEWYNTTANEILYSTGITNKARFEYIYQMQWLPNNEQETFVANDDTIQIESTVREFYVIKLKPIPTAMNQKFNLLCANDRVFGDTISFIRETEPEVVYFNGTNLYQINQQLTKGNYIFDNIQSDGSITVSGDQPLAIEDLGNGLLFTE